jgi:hypothetical protein
MRQDGIYKIYNVFNESVLQQEPHRIRTSYKETRIEGDRFLIVERIIKIGTKDWFWLVYIIKENLRYRVTSLDL